MTVEIGNILINFLEPLLIGGSGENPFIDKLAGVIKTVVTSDLDSQNRPVRKSFPVACGISYSECLKSNRYLDLVPNGKLKSIVYLEDNGLRIVGTNGNKNQWKASYKLVGWLNQKEMGYDDCSITSLIINEIINKFPELPVQINSPSEWSKYQRLLIEVEGQDPKSYNPFSKFSYDEDKTQYLMYPFDYFSLNLTVSFEMNKKCIEPFELKAPIPC